MGERIIRYYPFFRLPFYFGVLGGVVGVLVDLDHWFNTTGFKGWGLEGRPLHVPLAILACCLVVYSIARLRRLAHRSVLKNE